MTRPPARPAGGKAGKRGPVRRAPRPDLLALGLAALAVAVRLPHLGWGLPGVEEEALPMVKAFTMWRWDTGRVALDPQTAGWPSLSFYLQILLQHLHYAAGRILGTFADRGDYFVAHWLDSRSLLLLARGTSVAAVGGIVYLGARLARRLAGQEADAEAGREAALLAGALLALSPLLVRYGQLVTPDILVALFSALAIARVLRIHERGRTADYAWAGVFIGLGMSSKYTPALLLPGLFAAHALRPRTGPGSPWRRALSGRGPWLAVAAAALAFCATSPFVVLHLGTLARDVRTQVLHMTAGHFGQPSKDTGLVYYLSGVLGPGLGWGGFALALGGLAWAAARRRGPWLVLAWCVVPYYLALALLRTQFDRYMLPLLMPLAVGLGGSALALRSVPRLARGWPRAAAFAVLAGAVLVPAALGTLDYHREKARPSTQQMVNQYLRETADPQRTFVMAEVLSVSLPNAQAIQSLNPNILARLAPEQRRRVLGRPTYNVDYFPMYMVQPERSDVYYDLRHCVAHDLVVTSQSVRARYLAEPKRFPRQVRFYDDLERYGTLVRRFGLAQGARGPEIRVYRVPPARFAELIAARGSLALGFEREYADRIFRAHLVGFVEAVGRAAYSKGLWPTAALYYQTMLEEGADGSLAEEQRVQLSGVVAYARWRAGDLEGAEDFFRSYLSRVPNDLQALTSFAEVLEGRGKLAEARQAYQWCVRLGADSPEAAAVVARARARLAKLGAGGG